MSFIESDPKAIIRDYQLLRRLVRIPDSAAPSWKETRQEMVRSTPFNNQFRDVEVTVSYTPEGIQTLRNRATFLLWLRLKDAGREDEANKTIGRVWEPVAGQNKLDEFDRFINSIPGPV